MIPEPVQPIEPGTVLGHYVVQRALGVGGMGEVYEAQAVFTDR